MKRLTLRTENQWRSLKDGAGVDLLRVSFVCNGFQVGAGITVAGFGLGLTRWKRETTSWGAVIGAAIGGYVEPRTYAWEPIESNGWAGEPQGMEKAP
jgi:hypothetical protein